MSTKPHQVSPMRLLVSLLRGETKEVLVILVYGIGVGVLSLAVPIGIQSLVNTVTFGSFSQPVVFLVLTVFFGLSLAAGLRTVQITIVESLQKRFFGQIALELAYRIPRFRLHNTNKQNFPELVNRFFDVLTVQKSSATLLLEGFALALQIFFGFILIGFYHWFLLSFAIVMTLAVAAVLFLMGRGAIQTSIEESVQKYRVAAWLEEIAVRPLLFRSAEARSMALERADLVLGEYLSAREKHFSILMRQVMGSLALQAIGSSALLGIGTYLVVKNQLTLGQLVAAEIVVTTALASLAKFQKHLEAYYDLIAALDKIESLLNVPLERSLGEAPPKKEGPAAIEIRKISFRYKSGPAVFESLSFIVESGAKVALRGENASGKTTLVDLLFGIKSPQSGALLYDGVDYRDFSPELLRTQVALVRGLEILPGTIFDNVSLGRNYINADRVRECLNQVGLLNDVLQFEEGIHTRLGPDGSPFSVAQAQALVLARAIAGKPRLLIVDEALDELDERSRGLAIKVLLDPNAPWTLLLSTHSESLAKHFPKVILLDTRRERKSA